MSFFLAIDVLEDEAMLPRAPLRMAVREGGDAPDRGVGSKPGPSLMADVDGMGTTSPGRTTVMVGNRGILLEFCWTRAGAQRGGWIRQIKRCCALRFQAVVVVVAVERKEGEHCGTRRRMKLANPNQVEQVSNLGSCRYRSPGRRPRRKSLSSGKGSSANRTDAQPFR